VSLPRALLLHPDAGMPGFAQVEHMGSAAGGGGSPGWAAAAAQLVFRARWDLLETSSNASSGAVVELSTLSASELCAQAAALPEYDLVLGVDLVEPPPGDCAAAVQAAIEGSAARLFISSSPGGAVGAFWRGLTLLQGATAEDLEDPGPLGLRAAVGGWGAAAKLAAEVSDLWHRRTAEEAVYAMLVLIDGAVRPLDAMQAQKPVPDVDSVARAIDRCQDEFRACFTEPKCLQNLACLSACGLADQSCSYRCIVSYQNEAFTQFTLCALQGRNMLNSRIERPALPLAPPMREFRGTPLTHELAENILVGHFDPATGGQNHSWLVYAGSNPAYEQFAWQYQLWYKGEKRNQFWYRPTFLVEALDGRKIWRTRDYRVRRAEEPGMWEFSVLDNGIVSEEKWRLLGADDGLGWLVLFYVGAARKAGLSYRGCVVLTPDGRPPEGPGAMEGVAAAVERAGLRPWELEETTNPPLDPSNPPPLLAPETQPAAPLLRERALAAA